MLLKQQSGFHLLVLQLGAVQVPPIFVDFQLLLSLVEDHLWGAPFSSKVWILLSKLLQAGEIVK